MTRAIIRALAAAAIVLAFGLAPAAAQTGQMFGELVGKVTDDQGGLLPGVTVTLSGPAAMGTPTTTTNASGVYRFPAVNNGTYTVTVSNPLNSITSSGAVLTVVPVSVVKGLELDGVVVVEPSKIVAEEQQGLRALYVALTRSTRRLTIVHSAELPAAMEQTGTPQPVR